MTSQPNVLWIMTDQQRYDALGCLGHPVLKTPHLDRLASEGTLFKNCVCTAPLCGPSRASLLSGMFSHGHGCKWNYGVEATKGGMKELMTWDKALHQQGYMSDYFGKWHTGPANRECYQSPVGFYLKEYGQYIKEKGYPTEVGDGDALDRYTKLPYRFDELDRMLLTAFENEYNMPHHNEAGRWHFPAEDSLTAWTVQRTIDFLENDAKGPFNVTCSILHPHAPLIASDAVYESYDPAEMPLPELYEETEDFGRPPSIPEVVTRDAKGLGRFIATYYALITEVDHHIGRLLKTLEKKGYCDNTLVIFTSDHGEMMGEHRTFSKTNFWDGAWRVPLIMRWPGHINAGLKIDQWCSGVDLAPTILDLCGLDIPSEMHGRSLKSRLLNKGASANQENCAYGELHYPFGEIQYAIIDSEWKYVFRSQRCDQLYQRVEDHHETCNLALEGNKSKSHAQVIKDRREKLYEWLRSQGKTEARLLA